ncbi:phage tail protein [Gilliamella sp. Fer1-1]|uniref:phage tail protein n=1 Tax=Gilliamella sp. Fer1-1 TaxID=3120240 RepID=UPI0009BCB159|nr:phage tail protein [Gilliamella apicola]
MHRIDTATAQKDKFGQGKNGFTRGNPQTGTPATQLDYLYCDAIQEEIANAIESAGIKLDKSKHDQLASAIKEFVRKGKVRLSSATNSTSETEAATSLAVKKVNDLAAGAVKKSGDEITGQLRFSPTSYGMKFLHENSNELVMRPSGDSFIYAFYNAELDKWTNKLRYVSSSNTWRFENVDDVTINNKSVLKTGDYGIGSSVGAIANNFDAHLDGGFYQCRTVDFPDLQLSGNSTATLLAYPSSSATWKIEQLSVVNSKIPRVYYRCDTKEGKKNWYEAITTANVNSFLPVGIPLPWPQDRPPAGWFECNGASFDVNQFPRLASVFPWGRLPDLRGEFIRGWDNARGIDPGRQILSWQGDAIRNIHGEISPISETFSSEPIANGAFRYFEKDAGHTPMHVDISSAGGVFFDASQVVPTANENRPRNIAFMYIVKAE